MKALIMKTGVKPVKIAALLEKQNNQQMNTIQHLKSYKIKKRTPVFIDEGVLQAK